MEKIQKNRRKKQYGIHKISRICREILRKIQRKYKKIIDKYIEKYKENVGNCK